MHYVYLTNNVVTDQCQVDPASVFSPSYAAGFIQAADNVTFGWTYNGSTFSAPVVTPAQIQAQNKQKAQALLSQTDWTCTVDINNPTYSNPYLTNQDAFLAYRSTVRAIAVTPPTTPAVFPTQPTATWSNESAE